MRQQTRIRAFWAGAGAAAARGRRVAPNATTKWGGMALGPGPPPLPRRITCLSPIAFVGCVQRTVTHGAWCVSRTLRIAVWDGLPIRLTGAVCFAVWDGLPIRLTGAVRFTHPARSADCLCRVRATHRSPRCVSRTLRIAVWDGLPIRHTGAVRFTHPTNCGVGRIANPSYRRGAFHAPYELRCGTDCQSVLPAWCVSPTLRDQPTAFVGCVQRTAAHGAFHAPYGIRRPQCS